MKRAATRDKAKIAFYFDLRPSPLPPGANPRADSGQERGEENLAPGATRMCEFPGVAREDGQA